MNSVFAKFILLLLLSGFAIQTDAQVIPNFNFETWNSINRHFPTGMQTSGNVTQLSPGYQGNYAIKIQAGEGALQPGEFGYGSLSGTQFHGGIPFAASPDTIVGAFSYNIALHDTAWLFLILKSNGAVVGSDSILFTGSNTVVYATVKSGIRYRSVAPPDSLIFIVTSTSPGHINGQSYLIADHLHFAHSTLALPNGELESWYDRSYKDPMGWTTENVLGLTTGTYPVIDTSNHFEGKSSCLLTNISQSGYFEKGLIYSGVETGTGFKPGFPTGVKDTFLVGYYKFIPKNGDSCTFSAFLFRHDSLVGSGTLHVGDTVRQWSPFVVPITYIQGFTGTPDSAALLIAAYKWTSQASQPLGNSVLQVDELSFNSFLTGIPEETVFTSGLNSSPNPFTQQTSLHFELKHAQSLRLSIFDLQGKCVRQETTAFYPAGRNAIEIKRGELQQGMYFLLLQTSEESKALKVLVTN